MVSFAGKNSRLPAPRGGEARIQGSQSGSPIHVIPDTLIRPPAILERGSSTTK